MKAHFPRIVSDTLFEVVTSYLQKKNKNKKKQRSHNRLRYWKSFILF